MKTLKTLNIGLMKLERIIMTEVIKSLKNYNIRMKTAISELERLEYDEDFLEEIAESYYDIVSKCEHRREILQRRGRTQ